MNGTTEVDQMWGLSIAMVVVAAATLAVLVWRGCLRANAMADGPRRDVGLQWWDLPTALLVMVLGMLAFGGVGAQVFELEPGTTRPAGGIRAQAAWVLLSQLIGQGVVLAYVMWRTAAAVHGWRRFGLVPTRPTRDAWMSLLGLAAALPLVVGTLSLMSMIGEWVGMPAPAVGHELLDELLRSDDAVGLAMMIVAVVVVGPFFEELIFRGVVQTSLMSVLGAARRWLVVVIAAVVFALIHVGAGTFDPEGVGGVPWHALPGLAVLGVVLGWLYEKTGSLWPAVVVHGGFNAFNVAMVLAMQRWEWL
ncbi:lysostaphin resistance A-like protein [Phycisphaerales bacterium AB-hyl4]|uniref:Lysostaphin resistance A-like protein n=1 Tax=Natronomicrosphaera hydrolytica TaxID=3242702 RepID=A0ABV4U644_9BACT